jgi:hypothetical protein
VRDDGDELADGDHRLRDRHAVAHQGEPHDRSATRAESELERCEACACAFAVTRKARALARWLNRAGETETRRQSLLFHVGFWWRITRPGKEEGWTDYSCCVSSPDIGNGRRPGALGSCAEAAQVVVTMFILLQHIVRT